MGPTPENPLAMSDEDIMNMVEPPAAPVVDETPPSANDQPPAGDTPDPDKDDEQEDKAGTGDDEDDDDQAGGKPNDEDEQDDGAGDKPGESDNLPLDKSLEQGGSDESGKGEKPAETTDKTKDTPPDYQGFYEKMMSPLKANGKTIELKSPEEAIQLMQMGANYTRKMQALAPHRKILLMLENNGLLDEGKLSFLIDIEKKNPEAIKKLVKDSGIDPLDIDTTQDSTYREGNHRVSDEESVFRAALDELTSNPEGRETIKLINTQWDQASKEILWKQPEVMHLIQEQRDNGIYDLISTELERQRALGAVPPNVPFLQAYKKIGDDLAEAGAFAHLAKTTETKPQPSHVATRKATPKPAVTNGDKANAASTSRNAGRKAETVVNPLSLSDEEFEKQFAAYQGRV